MKDNGKRLVILSVYDREGIAREYLLYLLKSIKTIADRLVIICNGQMVAGQIERMSVFSSEIFLRENRGFDSGAYRYALREVIGSKALSEYSEVVLCNDTFYGPFRPWQEIFLEMEKQPADFWGLNLSENGPDTFLQSYFLVFRSRCLQNGDLYRFFEEEIDEQTEDIKNVLFRFERGIYAWFRKRGYRDGAYRKQHYHVFVCPDGSVLEDGLPILKRKAFSPQYYDEKRMACVLSCISKQSEYPVELILNDIRDGWDICLSGELLKEQSQVRPPLIPVLSEVKSLEELYGFVEKGPVYIWGTGAYGEKLVQFIDDDRILGFISSEGRETLFHGKNVYLPELVPDAESARVVLAMGQKNTASVLETVSGFGEVYSLWKEKKHRLAIYVLWNAKGHVDRYVLHCLKELKQVAEQVVVTVNGPLEEDGERALSQAADRIFKRENIGFDGGAYKDTILNFLKDENWEDLDELILANDTFYGPLYPWQTVFDVMEDDSLDFWGISSYYSDYDGEPDNEAHKYPYHVQGYFLVLKRTVLSSPSFLRFWREMPYPRDYRECISFFEVGLSRYLLKRGFHCSSFLEKKTDAFRDCYGIVLYLNEFDTLFREYDFPVIKYKVFSSSLEEEREEDILEYAEKRYGYDPELIREHQRYLDEMGVVPTFSRKALSDFYDRFSDIYIYGYGKMAKKVDRFFQKRGWKVQGYLVTQKSDEPEFVHAFSGADLTPQTGIVIAATSVNTKEILEHIGTRLKKEQIFCICRPSE